MQKHIVGFEEIGASDIGLVGGKGANLGEMLNAGINVPPGFIITAQAYADFVDSAGLMDEIEDLLADVDFENTDQLTDRCLQIRAKIENAKIPARMAKEILEHYRSFMKKHRVDFVAVRSSATAEDLPDASFAGQQDTFLYVQDEVEFIKAVKKCWSSLFTPRATYYRQKKGFEHAKVRIAVVVQKMVNATHSGVMFTSEPTTGEKKCIIEAIYGIGEAIVSGRVTPDTYIVDTNSMEILSKEVGIQHIMIVRGENGGTIEVGIDEEQGGFQKIPDEKIIEIAEIGMMIEEHYGKPMDVEWAMEGDEVFIVQARPVTTIKKEEPKKEEVREGKILLRGLPASPGIGAGIVKLVRDAGDLQKVKEGDILVTLMTTPDMVPAMSRAKGIVTDEGGMTCHAAIVSRELGIPCIVGTKTATQVLKDGMEVTVDGKLGNVYEGIMVPKEQKVAVEQASASGGVAVSAPITATKVLVNIGVPEKAEEYSKLPAQGVGLMRIEFIFTSYIKEHPVDLIKRGQGQVLIEKLAEGIAKVGKAFYPRPVIVRTSDFKTNEYRGMPNGEKYEPVEDNPMIGWRGCSRYISKEYEEAFRMELRAIAKVRNEMGLKNVHVMLPFVRNTEELVPILKMLEEENLKRGFDFKLYLMAEVPSIIFMADDFCRYCDGFSIGSNDLTQLIMGADRDSDVLAKMGYFDERNLAVKRAISHLIRVAHQFGKTVSICGQAPSVYPEFAEFLVEEGIDSISLNPDTVVETLKTIARAEQRIILRNARKQQGTGNGYDLLNYG
ncbi:MAG: phosphoenolpyruvate synthase [Thermoplasmata archaeon]|nr:phosphoenolpyruvate synthase [Thermoplasmata archaeon]